MATEVFVSSLPGEIRAAVLRDDLLDDLLILRKGMLDEAAPPVAGDVFFAKVRRFDKGLDGAFVDLGLERDGLLPRKEAPAGIPPEGSSLAVRVIRAPAADKGARVSARNVAVDPSDLVGLAAPAPIAGGSGMLDDFVARTEARHIVVDNAELLRRLKETVGGTDRDFELHSAATPLFEAKGLEEEVEALLAPRAELPGGGFLLIEPGQTLTAIDVNAGRSDGRGGAAAQAKAVNLAAVPAIARHLRLRALSGLIVVDFLTMKAPDDRKALAAALRQAVADDPEPCQVFGISPSGLLEMTRRRGRAPLHEVLCRPCGIAGSGRAKTPETLAYEALRAVVAGALGRVVTTITLKVAPEVAAALQGPQAVALAAVEQRLGRAVHIAPDPLVAAYALVLN